MIMPPFLFPERLPFGPPKPYIRPQRMGAQAVTIAAGFQCSDGVVLCADTEINVAGFVKFPGSKFRLYPRMACCPVFTFAGDVLYCEMLVRHIVESVLVAERQESGVLAAVQAKALSIHQIYAAEDYETWSGLIMSLWLGTEGNRQRHLFEIGGGVASKVSEAVLGTGQSVGRGVIAELFRPRMTVKEIALMAVYLLAEAKTYAYGVGKSSQILMLSNDGTRNVFPTYDPHHPAVAEMEEDYFRLKRMLRPIILGLSDFEMTPNQFAAALETLKASIVATREKRYTVYIESVGKEFQRGVDRALNPEQEDDE